MAGREAGLLRINETGQVLSPVLFFSIIFDLFLSISANLCYNQTSQFFPQAVENVELSAEPRFAAARKKEMI